MANMSWPAFFAGLRRTAHILYKSADHVLDHDGIEHAGYLAFLSLLALFPFLVLLLSVAGAVGNSEIGTEFVRLAFNYLPSHVTEALLPRVEEITNGPPEGLLTFAILGAIWTSSSAVEGYRTILNRAYRVASPPHFLWRRLLSIGQVLVFSFLIITGMLILIVLPIILEPISHLLRIPLPQLFATLQADLVQVGALAVLLGVVVSLNVALPNVNQSALWVLPGSCVTVLGWLLSARLFSDYLAGVNRINLVYGGLGGIIAVLVFFYVINVIFIYGAELNYLLKQTLRQDPQSKL